MPENVEKKEFMTDREQKLKTRLIALLRDDGKGHRHAKFAKRLENFIIKIVPRTQDPNMTAAIDWSAITIYISDGFLDNPSTFYQLNVLMRHELAHYLMQHEIRMTHKLEKLYGEEASKHLAKSMSFHNMLNSIEDFEISNTRYTMEDKQLVRNLILGGRIISGLVTEDIRANWQTQTLEQMYDNLSEEIDAIQNSILATWDASENLKIDRYYSPKSRGNNDYIDHTIKSLYIYTDIKSPTNFTSTLDKFIENKSLYHFKPLDEYHANVVIPCLVKFSSLPEMWQNIITAIAKEFIPKNQYLKADLRSIIEQIAKTAPTASYTIKGKTGDVCTVYSPEEKFVAIDCLKACIASLEPYETWRNKVLRVLSDRNKYSKEDLNAILSAISKKEA